MSVECDAVVLSRNHFSSGNATLFSSCIVELHVDVNNIKSNPPTILL
jgi:hypothetical protein